MSLVIWSAHRSGGRPLGRRHDEGGVQARMSMAWVPGCRRHILCARRRQRAVCGILSLERLSCVGKNGGVRDVIVPADTHNVAEGFCVESIETFLLSFGKCPRG